MSQSKHFVHMRIRSRRQPIFIQALLANIEVAQSANNTVPRNVVWFEHILDKRIERY
jgi:hypothetical protein